MKVKKPISILLISIVVVSIFFRNWIYRQAVVYKTKAIVKVWRPKSRTKESQDINKSIEEALNITSNHLSFTSAHCEVEADKLKKGSKTNCIGYANYFSDQLCKSLSEGSKKWDIETHRGEIYLFGTNVHDFFTSPFFKDHDFVVIKNNENGDCAAIDPSLYDYLWIKWINTQHCQGI